MKICEAMKASSHSYLDGFDPMPRLGRYHDAQGSNMSGQVDLRIPQHYFL